MKGAGPERSAQMTRRRGLALVAAGLVGFATAMMPTSLPAQTATPESQPLVLPPVIVSAPLPQPVPLPRSSIPGAIDTLTGKEVRETYPHVLPDALESRTGVTLQNEQGTPYQPDLNLRGFVASPVTGLPQGISIFRDGFDISRSDINAVAGHGLISFQTR